MMNKDVIYFKSKASAGFTLVEVLVVLSITAIIVGAATPSFMNIMANNRVAAASNELVTSLNLAKSEAVRSGQTIVLCKSPAANQCDNSASWNGGLLLFQDDNKNNSADNGERVIKLIPASEASLNFSYTGSSPNTISFNANGRTNTNGHFCFNNSYAADNSRAVVITQAGRIRAEKRPYDC